MSLKSTITRRNRRRFKNKFSPLPCILLRKTNCHIYIQLRINGTIKTEVNTLNMEGNLLQKAKNMKEQKIKIIKDYKIEKYYTDIFDSRYGGHIKYILS